MEEINNSVLENQNSGSASSDDKGAQKSSSGSERQGGFNRNNDGNYGNGNYRRNNYGRNNYNGNRQDSSSGSEGNSGNSGYRRNNNFRRLRRKVCEFCAEKLEFIDYTDVTRLSKFLSDRSKIVSRRSAGTCAKHQRR